MLRDSLPNSAESSRPPSPRRRLNYDFRDPVSTPPRPPAGAEFVGSAPAPPASTSHGISSAAFSPNYFKQFFIEERELGRGGKGVVLLVRHVLDGVPLGHFALKRIPVGDDHEWLEKVLVEVQLLQHLSHQNLVSYRHVWLEDVQITTFGPSVPCAFVLQQYCDAGDLHNYIFGGVNMTTSTEQLKQRLRRRSKHEPEPPTGFNGPRRLQFEEIYAFFKDIASGLNHLHVNNYIHRDLKPSNCLLHKTTKGLRVLVSDFGEVQAENQARKSTGATGTISYCAPEVLRRDPSTGILGNFTTKSDIFSLGMILYFLCFANLPYQNADNLNEENEDVDLLRDEIIAWSGLDDQRSTRPDLPDKLYRFLRRLLSLDPQFRPTAEEILQGIKTGNGLDEPMNGNGRAAGHIFDDRMKARISPIDTPSASPAPQNPSRARTSSFRQPSPTKVRLSPMHRRIHIPPPLSMDSEDEKINEDVSSPSGSLVLRSRHTSPIKVTPPSPLLPPRPAWYIYRPESLRTIKTALFLLKIISIYLPCVPVAARPAAGLSLLSLATLDLVLLDFGLPVTVALATLQFSLLLGMLQKDMLCLPTARIWEGL